MFANAHCSRTSPLEIEHRHQASMAVSKRRSTDPTTRSNDFPKLVNNVIGLKQGAGSDCDEGKVIITLAHSTYERKEGRYPG